jgi:hypothetical protein
LQAKNQQKLIFCHNFFKIAYFALEISGYWHFDALNLLKLKKIEKIPFVPKYDKKLTLLAFYPIFVKIMF